MRHHHRLIVPDSQDNTRTYLRFEHTRLENVEQVRYTISVVYNIRVSYSIDAIGSNAH